MRLLFLNHNLRDHGTWFRAFHLARELVRSGHDVTLLTASPHHWYRVAEEEVDGVCVVETPSWNPVIGRDDGWGPLDIAYRLGRVLLQPFDLVYAFAHPPTVYAPAWLARTLRRKPALVDWCDTYRNGIFPQREFIRAYAGSRGWRLGAQRRAERVECGLERSILRMADGATVISRELEEAALNEGISPKRLLRYPCGANLDAISPLDKKVCRRQLGIPDEGPFLGYVANYNPDEKFFLKAVGQAFRDYPSARLIARCPPFTRFLVEENGLAGRIIELGRQPFERMAAVLGAADVLALPLEDNGSNRGRWPNKFGDYLAAGRPIAANFIGDVAEYFPPPDSAQAIGIAAPCRTDLYGEAISDLLAHPERWGPMGAAGYHLAETRLNWRHLAVIVEEFLKGFL